ncbi:squalene/phytoene synthase family protein [Embleya sp. NBC_00896]|uniref:phytoene/squalene synthase family protein n=1 Tax=Embleya sp. NBC_00896 TaxID=2975961 RepID=UPI002F91BCC2|nr:squalene/phytoene synthase family protein [Embleya sp. NBC_00896]
MTERELNLAGITDPDLRAAYTTSTGLFRAHGRGRFTARYMFPQAKRPYLDAFFAFVTYLDDMADNFDRSVAVRAQRLDEWERVFTAFVKGEPPAEDRARSRDEAADTALARAFVHVMRTWELPLDEVPDYLNGQRNALHTREYETYEQLDGFVQTVTLLPAVWINRIFEPQSSEAEELCRHTITAFQLLDFLWDIHEDLELGRLYLPTEHLTRFGIDRDGIERLVGSGRTDRALRELVRFEIEEAKRHLDIGRAWPATLHPTSRTFMQLDIETHYLMIDELLADDCAFFTKPRKGMGFVSRKVVPRTLLAIGRANRINRQAELNGFRVPPPYQPSKG